MMDKYTLITGASRGIGLELAKTCASKQHNLILVSRSIDSLEELKATFNKNQKLYYIYCPNKYNIVKIDATRKETELIEKYI